MTTTQARELGVNGYEALYAYEIFLVTLHGTDEELQQTMTAALCDDEATLIELTSRIQRRLTQ